VCKGTFQANTALQRSLRYEDDHKESKDNEENPALESEACVQTEPTRTAVLPDAQNCERIDSQANGEFLSLSNNDQLEDRLQIQTSAGNSIAQPTDLPESVNRDVQQQELPSAQTATLNPPPAESLPFKVRFPVLVCHPSIPGYFYLFIYIEFVLTDILLKQTLGFPAPEKVRRLLLL
jgi:hypothetical protein